MNYLLSFILSFGLTALLTPLVRTLATRHGIMVLPARDRWHQKPTSHLGGVAIFLSFWTSAWVFCGRHDSFSVIFSGSILLFALGLLDDFLHIKPASKLIGQIVVACLMVAWGFYFRLYPLISVPVSILWYVGLMNAFNLLDNMDGLATGIACIASLTLGSYLIITQGQPEVILAAMALAGATLGFLLYNTHPATIFMGDCGSLFLGYLLATLSLSGASPSSSGLVMNLLIPVLLVSVPIFDMVFVTLMRFFHSRPISQGGKDHTSHRLVAFGVSQRKAVWILYGISLVSGIVVLLSVAFKGSTVLALSVILTITLFLFGMFLGEVKMKVEDPSDISRKLLTNKNGFILDVLFQHKRHFAEVLMDFILICLAYYGAFFLKFDGIVSSHMQHLILDSLPLVIVCQLINFFIFGLYRGVWKYVGLRDALAIVKAVSIGVFISGVLIETLFQFEEYSRAVLIIFWLMLLVLISGPRVAMKLFAEFLSRSILRQKRVIIIGAGDAGELLLRTLQNSHQREYDPVAFIDDNPKKIGRLIHGIPVLGNRSMLAEAAQKEKIDTAFITIPSATPEQLKEIEQECKRNNIRYRLVGTILESAEL